MMTKNNLFLRLSLLRLFSFTTLIFLLLSCSETVQDKPMSFTNNGDGTVTDNNTSLMWQRCSVGQNNDATCSGSPFIEDFASLLYSCDALSLGEYTDWRKPTFKELKTIVDRSIKPPGPTIRTDYFPNTINSGYWASESGYGVNFYNGNGGKYHAAFYGAVRAWRKVIWILQS